MDHKSAELFWPGYFFVQFLDHVVQAFFMANIGISDVDNLIATIRKRSFDSLQCFALHATQKCHIKCLVCIYCLAANCIHEQSSSFLT